MIDARSDSLEEDFRQLGSGTVLQRERALTRIERGLIGEQCKLHLNFTRKLFRDPEGKSS